MNHQSQTGGFGSCSNMFKWFCPTIVLVDQHHAVLKKLCGFHHSSFMTLNYNMIAYNKQQQIGNMTVPGNGPSQPLQVIQVAVALGCRS